jgi:phosphate transport system substrate-binding protein
MWRVHLMMKILPAGVLLLLSGSLAPVAAEHEPPLPMLHINVSSSGKAIFDPLLDEIAKHAGLTERMDVRYTEPLNGLRDFCQNTSGKSADLVLSTHLMEEALAAECAKNGAGDIVAVELARSALILAVRKCSKLSRLTSRQVYLALAREVPYRDEFVRNTSDRWSDIDPSLPEEDVRFQLPPRVEGSRAIFEFLVLEGGCRGEPQIKLIFNSERRTAQCVTTRSDRVREIPRPQAPRALLEAPPGTVGVVSQRDVMDSDGQLVALTLDDEEPTSNAIQRGTYEFSISFWLYAKRNRAPQGGAAGIDAFIEQMINEAQSEELISETGPLPGLGLVPLPADERAAQRARVAAGNQGFGLGAVAGWITGTMAEAWDMFGVRTSQPVESGVSWDFSSLMDIAGYRVTGFESSIGIIPDADMVFSIAREMSDSDHAFLERTLYHDSLARPGALAAMQRRIIRTIMGVREVGNFEVSKVDVVFLPLPKVTLTVTPKDVLRAQQAGPSTSNSE